MNTTQQAAPAAAPAANPSATPQPNGSGVIPSLEDRMAALTTAATSESAAEGAEVGSGTPSPASPAPSPAVSDAAKAAEERRARLDALKTRERASVDAKTRQHEADQIRARLEAADRERAALQEQLKGRIAPDELDEAKFFQLAEQLKVPPAKLADWLRERMANPEAAAAQAARAVVDPKMTALERKIAEQEQTIQRFLADQAKQREDAEEQAAAREFFDFTSQNASSAPYASAFLKARPNEFYRLALSAARQLPAGAGPQAILDQVEENLSLLAPVFGTTSTPSNGKHALPPHPAAAKAPTTVSNALAQERASVVDDSVDLASLSFEDRLERVKRML